MLYEVITIRDGRAGRHQLRQRDRERTSRARSRPVDRRLRTGAAGRPGTAAGHRPRLDHAAGDAQRAHAARGGQPAARSRQVV